MDENHDLKRILIEFQEIKVNQIIKLIIVQDKEKNKDNKENEKDKEKDDKNKDQKGQNDKKVRPGFWCKAAHEPENNHRDLFIGYEF